MDWLANLTFTLRIQCGQHDHNCVIFWRWLYVVFKLVKAEANDWFLQTPVCQLFDLLRQHILSSWQKLGQFLIFDAKNHVKVVTSLVKPLTDVTDIEIRPTNRINNVLLSILFPTSFSIMIMKIINKFLK